MKKSSVALISFATITASSLSTLLLMGCGGGGGSDDNNVFMGGTWQGSLIKTSDTCANSNAPTNLTFRDVVQQNGDAITLRDQSGLTYIGNRVGDNGFSVDASAASSNCSAANRIAYDQIDSDKDVTANVDFRVSRTCSGTACEVNYTGTATRASTQPNPTTAPGSTPIMTPGATPVGMTTPIAGGCPAMNTKPASGSFEGDGGCGISETMMTLTQNNQVVVLEPFGVNGATSFSVSGTNPASATTGRSDLTIKDEAGFTCSLACSAPATFTVSCFKEGGTTCVEKF